jgi:hypothetical protein
MTLPIAILLGIPGESVEPGEPLDWSLLRTVSQGVSVSRHPQTELPEHLHAARSLLVRIVEMPTKLEQEARRRRA